MPDVQHNCEAHRNKKIDPTLRNHVLFQLRAEGHKRLEGFLFERVFNHLVSGCLSESDHTSGWLFQSSSQPIRYDWFRLITPVNKWNSLDDKIADFLLGIKCPVFRVNYDYVEREFIATHLGKPTALERLDNVLSSLLDIKSVRAEPVNYKYINQQQQNSALKFMNDQFTDTELESLALSRTLVNCYLYPWYRKQPMDIDAAIIDKQGWSFVEFKRKYPAADGSFGLDENPHGKLADWLEQHRNPLLHVILVDPLWNKDESPIHLISQNSLTAQYAIWLGIELTKSVYATGNYSTSGANSGMTGGDRIQRKLSNEALKILGTGMKPEQLCSFLFDPDAVSSTNPLHRLKQERDKARAIFGK